MPIEFVENGTTLIVKPEGFLNTDTAPEVEEQMHPLLDGMTEVVFDLEKVTYVSSAGLRLMLATEQAVSQNGGSARLIHVNGQIRDILDMTGFLDMIPVDSD